MFRLSAIFLLLLLAACARDNASSPVDQERFYSYVDAQGNLVQMKAADVQDAEDDKQVNDFAIESGEAYQADEEVQARLKAMENDRFITYQDASGYRVVQPVRIADEKEALEQARDSQYEKLETPDFIDRIEPFTSDCCVNAMRASKAIRLNEEQLVTFREKRLGWIKHADKHPAYAFRLGDGVKALRVQSFIRKQHYLHPHLLILDEQGVPILYVDNLFDRRFPESWYRHGYVEGEFVLPPEGVVAVLYLPYLEVVRFSADGIGVEESTTLLGESPWQVSGLHVSAEAGEILIRGVGE